MSCSLSVLASKRVNPARRDDVAIQFARIQQEAAHPSCYGKLTAYQKHGYDFKKNILKQQSPAPCAGQEPIHEDASSGMMHISFVVKTDQEARIDDDHLRPR